jgi:hypothetical protein
LANELWLRHANCNKERNKWHLVDKYIAKVWYMSNNLNVTPYYKHHQHQTSSNIIKHSTSSHEQH